MATLIDKTYFETGQCYIPNSNETGIAAAAIAAEIQGYIDTYEEDFLRGLLGDTLYEYLVAHPSEARIVTLIAHLLNETTKQSPIANYVWFKYQQQNQIITTNGGDKQTSQSELLPASNYALASGVWNAMVTKNWYIYEWLQTNIATYPEWTVENEYLFEKVNIMDL